MTSAMLDSKHVFKSRAQSVGLVDTYITSLENGGIDTLSKLAYICSCQPGSTDDSPFTKIIDRITGHNATDNLIPPGVLSCIRRLWFEAHAVSLAEVKARIERSDDAPVKRLPLPEREARRKAQQAVLTGIVIEKQLEPSHSLIDTIYTMKEEEILKYIEPAQCTCRESELKGIKVESFLKLDSTGRVQQINKDMPNEADVSTEFRMRLALQRRSLALDQLQLVSYSNMEAFHDYLFGLLLQTPPEGFASVTMKQILIADRQAWIYAASSCREGISPRPDGSKPLERAFKDALEDPMVRATLQPMPKFRGHGEPSSSSDARPHRQNPYGAQNRREQQAPWKGSGKGSGKNKSFKGGGQRKGQSRGFTSKVPQALQGGKAVSSSGHGICFGYNLQGCSGSTPGGTCSKGKHICARCESSDHSFQNCPNKK
jgi:hypothetical protein